MYSLCPDFVYNCKTIEFYIAYVSGSVLPDKLYLHDPRFLRGLEKYGIWFKYWVLSIWFKYFPGLKSMENESRVWKNICVSRLVPLFIFLIIEIKNLMKINLSYKK